MSYATKFDNETINIAIPNTRSILLLELLFGAIATAASYPNSFD